MLRRVWDRLDRGSRVALVAGLVLAVAAIPLPTLGVIVAGAGAAILLGFLYPATPTRVGALVAGPMLAAGFLVGLIRGVGVIWLVVILGSTLIAPVYLARVGAGARTGRRTTRTP
jgi:hypothetical protein